MCHRVPEAQHRQARHRTRNREIAASRLLEALSVTHNHKTVTFFLFTSLSNQPNYTEGVQKDLRCEVRKMGGKA